MIILLLGGEEGKPDTLKDEDQHDDEKGGGVTAVPPEEKGRQNGAGADGQDSLHPRQGGEAQDDEDKHDDILGGSGKIEGRGGFRWKSLGSFHQARGNPIMTSGVTLKKTLHHQLVSTLPRKGPTVRPM
jgi:hypothetical protein